MHTSRRFLKNLETAANAIETTMIVATDAYARSLAGCTVVASPIEGSFVTTDSLRTPGDVSGALASVDARAS